MSFVFLQKLASALLLPCGDFGHFAQANQLVRDTDPQSENSVDIFSVRFDFPLDFFSIAGFLERS